MMKLLYKELRLTAHPSSIAFAFLGCLVIVPAYPYSAIFLFGCLAPYITFVNARETNDAWYTAVLPVTKRESVKGKMPADICVSTFPAAHLHPICTIEEHFGHPQQPGRYGCHGRLVWVWADYIRGF